MDSSKYDVFVIWPGQEGYPISKALVNAVWKTAVIETAALEGPCVNSG